MPALGRRLSPATLLAALALATAAPGAHAQTASREKIAPWVTEHATLLQPAEFIVVLKDRADLAPAARMHDRVSRGRFVHDALVATARRSQAPLLAWLRERGLPFQSFTIVNAVLVTARQADVLEIAARPDVERIEGNPVLPQLQPVTLSPDELAASLAQPMSVDAVEPGVSAINAPGVWALGITGQGIVIGSADTGVKWDHAALKARYRGWNGVSASHDYNWHDSIHGTGSNPCGYDLAAPCDDYGHGTHTTGTACGTDGATNQIGVAPGAQFIACRNMDGGNGTPARYLECMEWFLAPYPIGGTPAQGDPSKAPDVTINSWGCPASEGCGPLTLQAAVEAQRAAGIMFVAAAGNSGSSCSTTSDPPSFYDASYTVGAYSATSGSIASFSSRGPALADGSGRRKPDITAPGVSVRSSLVSGGYGNMSGTSMATPHVAGAVALLWSGNPDLRHDIDSTEVLFNRTAVGVSSTQCDAGGIPNNVWGYGKLDVLAAVTLGVPLGVAPDPHGPAAGGVSLAPAFPNPARRSTLLRYRIASAAHVELALFTADGRRVRTLARETSGAGEHTLHWDGRDDRGDAVPPAMYLVRLLADGRAAGTKLIWLGR